MSACLCDERLIKQRGDIFYFALIVCFHTIPFNDILFDDSLSGYVAPNGWMTGE
jgi:hypothetical protein